MLIKAYIYNMAKLIIETDDGQQHEVKINQIKTQDIVKDDVIIANFEVGSLATDKNSLIGQELYRLKQLLEKCFPKGQKILVAATRNGIEDISIKIVKTKKV